MGASLSDGSQIEAYTGSQFEPDQTIEKYEQGEQTNLEKMEGVSRIALLSANYTTLGSLRARRFAIKFLENGQWEVLDETIALYGGVEYLVELHASESKYESHKPELETILSSWRLIPRSQ